MKTIQTQSRPHPNQHGPEPRVRLAGGPLVDKATLADLHLWQGRGTSYGVTIDRLVAFAKEMSFDPTMGLQGAFTGIANVAAYPIVCRPTPPKRP